MIGNRKKRSDRNHILYLIENKITGQSYVGLSAMIGQAKLGTLKERFRRHLSRATHEDKSWSMHVALRAYPNAKYWDKTVICVVRGRKAAHQKERELIAQFQPDLNTF